MYQIFGTMVDVTGARDKRALVLTPDLPSTSVPMRENNESTKAIPSKGVRYTVEDHTQTAEGRIPDPNNARSQK